ncbi:MAG: hypothetical protein ACRDUV_02070, partial [Pseudonocardiaceae bacterium]
MKHIDAYLSACHLGITICSIGLGITAEWQRCAQTLGHSPGQRGGTRSAHRAELRTLIEQSEREGILDPEERAFTEGVFNFGDLEQIVGDIRDEYDPAPGQSVELRPDGTVRVTGEARLEAVGKELDLDVGGHREATFGGWIIGSVTLRPRRSLVRSGSPELDNRVVPCQHNSSAVEFGRSRAGRVPRVGSAVGCEP